MINFEALKIPQDLFDAAVDKVILFKEEHKVAPLRLSQKVTEKVPHPTIPNRLVTKTYYKESVGLTHTFKTFDFGIGLLNMIALYTLDYGYTYDSRSGDTFFLKKKENTLRIDLGEKFTFSVDNGIRSVDYSIKKTTNGVVTYLNATYTVAQIAEILGTTEAEATEWVNGKGWVWNGGSVDVNTHVANIFPTIAIDEQNKVVTCDLLVNGKSYTEYDFGSLVFPFGQSGRDFVVDWVLYNQHEASNPPQWLSEGNFGEAATYRITQKSDARAMTINVQIGEVAGYDEETHTFTYNPTKQSIVSFQAQLKPAQGKNDLYEVCLDLNTGNVYYSRIEALQKSKGLILGA